MPSISSSPALDGPYEEKRRTPELFKSLAKFNESADANDYNSKNRQSNCMNQKDLSEIIQENEENSHMSDHIN